MSVTTSCPKCGVLWPADKPLPVTECPACDVNFAKFNAARVERQRQLAEQADRAAKAEKQMADRAAKAEKKAATAATKVKLHAAADAKLAACATCGGSVAYGAKTCPHCGAPGPTKPTSVAKLAIVSIGVIAILVAIGNGGGGSSSPPPRGSATDTQREMAQLMIKGKGYRCDDIEYMAPLLTKPGYRVTCNASRYVYELVDEGGRWVVRLD